MSYEYKNQFHIDSVSMMDSGKYFVDFIFPHGETIQEKITLKINRADYEKCKRAMDMQGHFPMNEVAKELGQLASAVKLGGKA